MGKNRGEDYIEQESVAYVKRRMRFKYWAFLVAIISVFVGCGVYISLRFRGQAMTNIEKVYSCTYVPHVHTDECYGTDENGNVILTCGYADYCIHTHNDDCYNEEGELICELPEIEEHVHTDECYEEVKVLVCGLEEGQVLEEENTSTESTETESTEIEISKTDSYEISPATSTQENEDTANEETVNEETSNEETANEETSNEEPSNEENSTDEKSEEETSEEEISDNDSNEENSTEETSDEENKTDETANDETITTTATGHVHTDACYETIKVLTCEIPTLHTHTDECYDENGNLICGKLELVNHVHTEDCFAYEDVAKTRNVEETYYAETEHCKVTIVAPEEANIPEEAVLKVEEITEEIDPEFFRESVEKKEENTDLSDYDLTYVLNIGFYINDEEIEPEADVEVTIEVIKDEEEEESSNLTIIHFNDEGDTDVMESTESEENKTTFETGSFSAYGVLEAKYYGSYSLSFNTEKNGYLTSDYYDANSPLGVAGNFHVVAFDTATINVHCAGNILAKNLYANSNFGSDAAELSYIQNYLKVNSASGGSGDCIALGDSATISVYDNGNHLQINGSNNDNFYNIIQDADTTNAPYIDLSEVLEKMVNLSSSLSNCSNTNVVFTDNYGVNGTDGNAYFTVTDASKSACYNMTAAELESCSPNNTYIDGLDTSSSGSIIINVDCSGKTSVNLPERLIVSDKNLATKVLWNFYNSDGITINTKQIDGCILAPKATVNVYGELNGQVIAKNVNISNSESHCKKYDGNTDSDTSVEHTQKNVTKVWKDVNGNVTTSDLPDSVKVELYYTTDSTETDVSNMTDSGLYATLDTSNDWTYTFTNLNKYDSNKNLLYYYVYETDVLKNDTSVKANYANTVTFDTDGNETITNQLIDTDIYAKKYVDSQTPSEDETFKFNLYSREASYQSCGNVQYEWKLYKTVENSYENIVFDMNEYVFYSGHTYYFLLEENTEDVDEKYTADTSKYLFKITYYLNSCTNKIDKEVYRYKLTDDEDAEDYVLTNCKINTDYITSCESLDEDDIVFNNKTKTTSITVKKKWQDAEGNTITSDLPESVYVSLFATTDKTLTDETEYIETDKSVELNSDNSWKYTFEDLDYFDSEGNVLYYVAKETSVLKNGDPVMSNYTVSYSNKTKAKNSGTITITNRLIPVDEETEITVIKRWYDSDGNQTSNSYVDEITFNLWQICETVTITETTDEDTDSEDEDEESSDEDTDEDTEESTTDETTSQDSTEKVYGTYTVTSAEGWTKTITGLPLKATVDGTTYKYSYCVEEVVTPNSGYALLGYGEAVNFTENATKEEKLEQDVENEIAATCDEDTSSTTCDYSKYDYYGNYYGDCFRPDYYSYGCFYGHYIWSGCHGWYGWYGWPYDCGYRYYPGGGGCSGSGNEHWGAGDSECGGGSSSDNNDEDEDADDTDTGEDTDAGEEGPYHSEIVTSGQVIINNVITATGITVYKYWYDQDNEKISDGQSTEVSITVEIYQTTSETISETHENETLIGTYILMQNGISKKADASETAMLARVPLQNYNGNESWAFKIYNLPVYDTDGNAYYYYAVETKVGENPVENTGYKVIYGTDLDTEATTPEPINEGTIIINNIGTPTYDFLPNTGGKGTILYRLNKWINELFMR